MSEQQIPDFKTLEDFQLWVEKLEDKEIQSWTTKDWLKMYEKLDAYIESADFDKIYREHLPTLIENGKLGGTIEQLTDKNICDVDACKRIAFISDEKTRNLVGNLYANFRFEPEQLETIKRLGKEAGEQLAKDQGINLAAVDIQTTSGSQEELYKIMNSANDITINKTNYPAVDNNYRDWFSVHIDDEIETIGLAVRKADGTNKLLINSKKVTDGSVRFSFHEAAHLHMQNGGIGQRNALANLHIRAVDDLSDDFFKLMEKNQQYYVSPRSGEAAEELYKNIDNILGKDARRIKTKDFNRYHKQPTEKFSEIYGIEAERAFRRETGYYSESTANKVAEYISGAKTPYDAMLGDPEYAISLNDRIELTYKSEKMTVEELETVIKKRFANADKKLLDELNIRAYNAIGEVHITVPSNYDFSSRFNKFLTTPPPIPPMTNEIQGATQIAEETTAKTITKTTLKQQAAKAGAKVAQTAKTAGKATKETLLTMNKAYDDTFDAIMKWGDKHAPQWMNKVEKATVQKAAEKFMKTKSGQAIAKQIEKKVGKEVAASIAKKIPILCLGVGAACVYDRLKEGDYMKAIGEGASALVANVPGLGTLASLGIDSAMLSDDIKIFEHGVMQANPNSHVAAESTFVEKPELRQQKLVRKVNTAEEKKKKAESKKKAQQFENNLYRYGGKTDFFDR